MSAVINGRAYTLEDLMVPIGSTRRDNGIPTSPCKNCSRKRDCNDKGRSAECSRWDAWFRLSWRLLRNMYLREEQRTA